MTQRQLEVLNNLSKEEALDIAKEYLWGLTTDEKFELIEKYCEANKYEPVIKLNYDTVTDIFNDSLTNFWENLDHAKHFSMNDNYMRNINGWYESFDDLDDQFSSTELEEYVANNFDEFRDDMSEDLFDDVFEANGVLFDEE